MLNINKSNLVYHYFHLVFHFFHLVSPFLWPLFICINLLILTSSKDLSMHTFPYSCLQYLILITFLSSIIYTVYLVISSLKKKFVLMRY